LGCREMFGALRVDGQVSQIEARASADDVRLPAGGGVETDWLVVMLQDSLDREVMGEYAELVGRWNGRREKFLENVPTGWCSWYHFYEKVTEHDLEDNLKKMTEIRSTTPLGLFQIDDGYQLKWGNWLQLKDGFSHSLKYLADSVRAAGFQPGLWLAPFAADLQSPLAKACPDWVLKTARGFPASSAFCGKFFYGLDSTRTDVQDHVKRVLDVVVHEWGFKYLKLDFLYAAVLGGSVRQDYSITRAKAMYNALKLIRDTAGDDVFILGCGCPLGSSIGLVDANRVSADSGPSWFPELLPDKWNIPCGRNMVRNSINRLFMHRRWFILDPDCILLRNATKLTDPEVRGIASVIAMTGGSLLVSDDLDQVPEARLAVARALMPVTGIAGIALDLFDREMPERIVLAREGALGRWTVAALCNWDEKTRPVTSAPLAELLGDDFDPVSDYYAFEFWTSTPLGLLRGEDAQVQVPNIPRHSASLVVLRKASPAAAAPDAAATYVGSNIHFTCGDEVKSVTTRPGMLTVTLFVGRDVGMGFVYVAVPPQALKVEVSGSAVSGFARKPPAPLRMEFGVWRIPVSLEQAKERELVVEWDAAVPLN